MKWPRFHGFLPGFLLFLVHLPIPSSEAAQFTVVGPDQPVTAVVGGDVELVCHLTPPMSAENMEVRWFRTDFSSLVHMYRNGKEETDAQMPEYVGRTDLLRGGLRDGRVALRLRNVQPSDEGRYACYFQSVSFYSEAPLELRVAALGSTPLLSVEGYQDGGIRVVCRSAGWYPEPQVSWRDVAGQQVPPLSETKFQRDGVLFGAETSILVTPLANQNVSCSVGNSRLGQEKGSAVYIAESFFPKESPWIAVLCTLLVVQLGVIGFLIYFFTTKERKAAERRWKDCLADAADVTLDPDTANPYLILSADRKSVHMGDTDQKPPTHPKRFVYSPCVLGQEGFTQGRHYWGVDVGRRGGWAVGVARESVSMGQDEVSLKPDAGVWAIERQWWGKSWALTNSKTPLELSRNPQRIRVSLDYEAGLVEFFDADQAKPFCVFSPVSFGGERLFPFFRVGGGAARLRLSVSAGSPPLGGSRTPKDLAELSSGTAGNRGSESTVGFPSGER